MNRKREKPGLTLIEILTVIAIIALLIGILIPAVTAVRDAAKEVKQTGQFTTIELGLTAFKNDFGDYPPSSRDDTPGAIYCGSQKLTEALLGWDLVGFHPDSDWRAAGAAYNPALRPATFDERKKPYLESGTQYAFTLMNLFGSVAGFPAGASGVNRYVLCDVFGATQVTLPDGSSVNAGAPILYYKADPSGRFNNPTLVDPTAPWDNRGNIYNYGDNGIILQFKDAKDGLSVPVLRDSVLFYDYIQDPKITAKPTPYNASSYILISAGPDGAYGERLPGPDGRLGTPDDECGPGDDIRNFGD